MVYSLSYRRPAYVRSKSSTSSERESIGGKSFGSGSTTSLNGIPEALSFERVISGGTCPPCTTREFMDYLMYIELSAENLQFYLWLRDYIKRFEGLPENEKALSPNVDTKNESDAPRRTLKKSQIVSVAAEEAFKGTEFAATTVTEKATNPFEDEILSSEEQVGSESDAETITLPNSTRENHDIAAANAFNSVDVKIQPFTIQPFRQEITRVIATYISDGAPRQLNLASKERKTLLQELAVTTHPSAFRTVSRTVEWSLRRQAHPNFIRWTICNGNRPRVIFARGLGIAGIVAGILTILLLTLSSRDRAWRVFAAIPFLIGIATLIAAWKGMCVVLHGMHHRHLRPWELFVDADEMSPPTYNLNDDSLDSLTAPSSYEDEPWVAKYSKRNVIRKVFDREVWIQEPALRQIQDTIFIQAILSAVLLTAVIVGVFCAIPVGNRL